MKRIELTQGKFALVDDLDYKWLNQWKWNFAGRYARRIVEKDKVRTYIHMHRLIMDAPEGMTVDHKNGNELDNRKENLRVCTQSLNSRNHRKNKNNTSGFKGVSWNKLRDKWHVGIWLNRKNLHIGYFSNKIEAAKAYNQAALKHHGEYANLNQL